jgi:beta-N-acetylhexosaminidase
MRNIRRLARKGIAVVAALVAASAFTLSDLPTTHASAAVRVASLTPQQSVGQRVIYSYPGLTPPASLLQHISNGEAAGVIFFSYNISSAAQIASVIQQLRQAQSPGQPPLLLMTDQEGGVVKRLPGEPTLSEKQIGQSANPPAQATQAGLGAGQNLAGVGMNVNLAPVLDVYYQPGNFDDQSQRSYSDNAATVATLGQNFITAQQQTGVAATAKHFPGLGSATQSQNTDAVPVTLNVSLSNLRSIDEVPYPAAITAGVKLIMVSWATYPALDSTRPAGLSPTVVQQELRTRMGFQGVTPLKRADSTPMAPLPSGPCWRPRREWISSCARQATSPRGRTPPPAWPTRWPLANSIPPPTKPPSTA